MALVERTYTVQVPSGAGVDGFLHTLRHLLRKPRVQSVSINALGQVSYVQQVPEDTEAEDLPINFEDVAPYAVVRRTEVVEVDSTGLTGGALVSVLFDCAASDSLYPRAFVVGAACDLRSWFAKHAGIPSSEVDTRFFGLPILVDRMVPDTTLLLTASPAEDSSFAESTKTYKAELP